MHDCNEETVHEHQFGCKLVGIIPVSDAFGVDLIIERYAEQTKAFEEAQKKKQKDLMESNPKQL